MEVSLIKIEENIEVLRMMEVRMADVNSIILS